MKRLGFCVALFLAVSVVPLLAALPYTKTCAGFESPLPSPFSMIHNAVYSDGTQCRGGQVDDYNVGIVSGETFNPDHYMQAEWPVGGNQGLCVRMTGSSLATFDGYCIFHNDPGNSAQVYRFDDGIPTPLGSAFGDPDGLEVRLEAVDDDLQVFYDDVSQGTRTDATYATGKPGLNHYSNSGFAINLRADNVGSGGGGGVRRLLTTALGPGNGGGVPVPQCWQGCRESHRRGLSARAWT